MTKTEFLTLWQENKDGRHNEVLKQEVARVFNPDNLKDKPWLTAYDFEDGKLVKLKSRHD